MSHYKRIMETYRKGIKGDAIRRQVPYPKLPFEYPFPAPIGEERLKMVLAIFPNTISYMITKRYPIGYAAEPQRCLFYLSQEIQQEQTAVQSVLHGLHDNIASSMPRLTGTDKEVQELEILLHRFSFKLGHAHKLIEAFHKCSQWATVPLDANSVRFEAPVSGHSHFTGYNFHLYQVLPGEGQKPVAPATTEVQQAGSSSGSAMAVDDVNANDEEDDRLQVPIVVTDVDMAEADVGEGEAQQAEVVEDEVMSEDEDDDAPLPLDGEDTDDDDSTRYPISRRALMMRSSWENQCRYALETAKVTDIYHRSQEMFETRTGGNMTEDQLDNVWTLIYRLVRNFRSSLLGRAIHQGEAQYVNRRVQYIEWRGQQPTRRNRGLEEWAMRIYERFDTNGVWKALIADIEASLGLEPEEQERIRTPEEVDEFRRLVALGRQRRLAEGQVFGTIRQGIKDVKRRTRALKRRLFIFDAESRALNSVPPSAATRERRIEINRRTKEIEWHIRNNRQLLIAREAHLAQHQAIADANYRQEREELDRHR